LVRKLTQAVLGAIQGLEGEVLTNEPEAGRTEAKFKKTILGNVLRDRTKIEVDLVRSSPEETKLTATIFPIIPVGLKYNLVLEKSSPRRFCPGFLPMWSIDLNKQ